MMQLFSFAQAAPCECTHRIFASAVNRHGVRVYINICVDCYRLEVVES